MRDLISFTFLVLLIAGAASFEIQSREIQVLHQSNIDKVIDSYIAKGNTKELFKVWHSLYRKQFDYNTEEGLKSYKTFKNNLKVIQEHNSKPNETYKLGINEFSDKTPEELEVFFGIKAMTELQFKQQVKRGLLNFDDYNDVQDELPVQKKNDPEPPRGKVAVNHTSFCTAVENQGGCGSCWAFSVGGAVEANYYKKYSNLTSRRQVSKQQLVSCDYNPTNGGNWGCSGGWMRHANDYYKANGVVWQDDYGYTASESLCQTNKPKSPVVVLGYEAATTDDLGVYNMLAKGPVSQCVNIQSAFYSYKSGIYNPPCTLTCHHAIVVVGWEGNACVPDEAYWIARNSWGSSWGESGYFKVKDTGLLNAFSCMLGHRSYSLRPIIG